MAERPVSRTPVVCRQHAMALNIIALCIFIFGAYAYGSVVVLTSRHGSPVWSAPAALAPPLTPLRRWPCSSPARSGSSCTPSSRSALLMGEPPNDDLIDLAALELVFMFPGLIFHTVLLESGAEGQRARCRRAADGSRCSSALYGAGAGLGRSTSPPPSSASVPRRDRWAHTSASRRLAVHGHRASAASS